MAAGPLQIKYNMPPNNTSILSTSHLDAPVIDAALQQGIGVDAISFIQTKPIQHTGLFAEIQALAHQQIVVVFTSTKALEAVAQTLTHVPKWKIFSLSGATKKLALNFFGEQSIIEVAANSLQLSQKIIEAGNIKEIIFFCGELRLNDLPKALAENNIKVKELMVYQTIPTPVALQKKYDAILFYSPSGVHSFFGNNTIEKNVVLFAMGQTTATAIQAYCSNQVVLGKHPDKQLLLQQATAYFIH